MLLWIVILLCAIAIAGLWCASANTPSMDKWPPISEQEFIRRCSPGVNRDRGLRVRRLISEQLGVEYDRVYPEQRFIEDLGCD